MEELSDSTNVDRPSPCLWLVHQILMHKLTARHSPELVTNGRMNISLASRSGKNWLEANI
jgi:hypothetical protein